MIKTILTMVVTAIAGLVGYLVSVNRACMSKIASDF